MLDAFSSLEYFTFGTKVPANKPKAAMLPIPKSRLEYQSRTTVVNVKGGEARVLRYGEKSKIFV